MKENKYSKEEYNDEPVMYCSHCNSLHIKTLDNTDIPFCVDCGNTDMEESHIKDWINKKKQIENKYLSSLDLDKIISNIINK